MKPSRRRIWIVASIILGVIILLTIFIAPSQNQLDNGSTYGKFPDGYAGWYAFMQEREAPIGRWKKSFQSLIEQTKTEPITLLRVYGNWHDFLITETESKWVQKGNTLIILGLTTTVTEADFTTQHQTASGDVRIDTTRRKQSASNILLGDSFGAIVWEEKVGTGHLIYATTPYLAANAYQDNLGNYQFLAELIESDQPRKILIDESIHGYQESETREGEQNENDWLLYLAKTPFLLLFVQILLIGFVAFWHQSFRFGKPLSLSSPTINNSQAYIDALASLLQTAERSEFIIETVGKEEQLQLQKKLGLKSNAVDDQALIQAWSHHTQQSITPLKRLLKLKDQKRSISEEKLLDWMQQWQKLKDSLSK